MDYLSDIFPTDSSSLTQAELDMRIRSYPVSVPGDLTFRYRLNGSTYDAINVTTGTEYFGRTANIDRVRSAAGYQGTTVSVPGPDVPTAQEQLEPSSPAPRQAVPPTAILAAGALAIAALIFGVG